MRTCLFVMAGLIAAQAVPGAPPATAAPSVRSVVRTDSRSGRLVRTIVVKGGASALRPASQAAAGHVPQFVREAAERHDVDPLLVHSMILVESGYNPYAISPKGAQGLMQLIPATARRFGVHNSFNFRENLDGGVRYFKYLLDLFEDQRLAVAAYNAGENAVTKYGGIPPYPETRNYVELVSRRYDAAKRAGGGRTDPVDPRGDTYRPVEYFSDDQGRLHIRTR